MTLGERLKKSRVKRGLTLNDVSVLTRVHETTISKIELGKSKTPTFETIVLLAKYYEIPLDDLAKLL